MRTVATADAAQNELSRLALRALEYAPSCSTSRTASRSAAIRFSKSLVAELSLGGAIGKVLPSAKSGAAVTWAMAMAGATAVAGDMGAAGVPPGVDGVTGTSAVQSTRVKRRCSRLLSNATHRWLSRPPAQRAGLCRP